VADGQVRKPHGHSTPAEPAVAPTKPAGRPYVTRVGQYDDRGKFVGANSARLVATKPLDADSATEAEMLARAATAPDAAARTALTNAENARTQGPRPAVIKALQG
jgi:hypothetical protein